MRFESPGVPLLVVDHATEVINSLDLQNVFTSLWGLIHPPFT